MYEIILKVENNVDLLWYFLVTEKLVSLSLFALAEYLNTYFTNSCSKTVNTSLTFLTTNFHVPFRGSLYAGLWWPKCHCGRFFASLFSCQPFFRRCCIFISHLREGQWGRYRALTHPTTRMKDSSQLLSQTAHSPSKHKDKHGFIISQCKHTEL